MTDTIIRIIGFQHVPQSDGWRGAVVTLDLETESFEREIVPFLGWRIIEHYRDRYSDWPDISASTLEPVFWFTGEPTSERDLPLEDFALDLVAPGAEPDWSAMERRLMRASARAEAAATA